MINLRNSPFLWLALLLLIPMVLGADVMVPDRILYPSILLIGASMVGAVLKFMPGKQVWATLCIALIILIAGMLRVNAYTKETFSGSLQKGSEFRQGVFEVVQVLKNKGTQISLKCRSHSIFHNRDSSSLKDHDKFILLSIRTGSPQSFLPGDVIRAEGWYSAIKPPLNPDAFDARIYYHSMGIRHQMFCKSERVSLIESQSFSVARMTAAWQSALSGIVRENVSPHVAQLSNALVWGDRSDLDPEIRDAFADSGAMHVLSVSGMHVAIIYSMLYFILGPPSAGRLLHRLMRFSIYGGAIFLYMGLTGSCPAVVRAGLMIMLYLLGKTMGWNTQIWNLLGFAAFMMIWLNPFIWQHIGFQLSFLAMAGILLFAKPIIRFYSFKKILLHRCWEITALSLSAQIFLMPVLLSQFHQFPLTFILSSIVAVPAAYLVMAGAIVNVMLSCIGIDLLWPALDLVGKIFITVMQWISELNPLMHFSLPSTGSILLMAMAIVFSFGIVFRWESGRKLGWACAFLVFVNLGCNRIRQWNSDEMVIYHSTRGLLIDIVENGICYSSLDCSLSPASIEYATRGFRCRRDIIRTLYHCKGAAFEGNEFTFQDDVLSLKDLQVLIWNSQADSQSRHVTHLVVDDLDDEKSLQDYLRQHPKTKIILPAHLDRFQKKKIRDFMMEQNIQFYDIDESGYFRMEI